MVINGILEVPENRTKENGRTIKLAYTVLKATGENPKKDPILYLQGGPGGPTLAMTPFWENNSLRKNRDIVLMDQRGTGQSNAVCENLGAELVKILAKDLTPEGEYNEMQKILEVCRKQIVTEQVDLSAYNSRENAADFEELRKTLGYDKWNIYGGSYGSRLGLTIMRDFPNSVRTASLFGVFAPETNLYAQFVSNFKQALFGTFDACKQDPQCNEKYPDLKDDFRRAVKKLELEPYTFTYNENPWVMNVQDFLLVLHQLLYTKATIGQIPAVIQAVISENDTMLRGALAPTIAVANLINFAMYMSVNAYDELPFNDDQSLQSDLAANPEIPEVPAFFGSDPKLLQDWHPYRAEPYENAKVISDIPTLVFNGGLDPITPPINAEKAAGHLSKSYYMLFKNEGHSFFSPCFFEISTAFLNNPNQKPSADCISRLPPIPWN